ncbi:MAG TPA: SET domain-containing protein-lysine N-methyltransferase [Candidatus Acidoferrales bacterium]|nr:SET domain-containing protein-lysine N-methyltransferase [Candidatus Acidoferrales bacterium]
MPRTRRRIRRFSVRASPIHGRGVFALTRIPRGTRLIEYKGERISHAQASARYDGAHEQSSHTMLFTVDERVVIDGGVRGNSARWINHSCAPNCEAVDDRGRIFIETIRVVKPGEELTYDYNLQLDERHTRAAKRKYACACGARRCRGTLLGSKR